MQHFEAKKNFAVIVYRSALTWLPAILQVGLKRKKWSATPLKAEVKNSARSFSLFFGTLLESQTPKKDRCDTRRHLKFKVKEGKAKTFDARQPVPVDLLRWKPKINVL